MNEIDLAEVQYDAYLYASLQLTPDEIFGQMAVEENQEVNPNGFVFEGPTNNGFTIRRQINGSHRLPISSEVTNDRLRRGTYNKRNNIKLPSVAWSPRQALQEMEFTGV